MSNTWSMTFTDGQSLTGLGQSNLINTSGNVYKANTRTELRESTGQILRLGQGAEFSLLEDSNGITAETYGEVFLKNSMTLMSHKYRSSCYTCGKIGNTIIDLFMKNLDDTTDEFMLISGCLSIFEYDENNRPFVICSLSQGEKATMKFDPDAPTMKDRYSAAISAISDKEYDYIVDSYLDPRKWQ